MTFAKVEDVDDGFQREELLQVSAAVFFQRRHAEHVGVMENVQHGMYFIWKEQEERSGGAAHVRE